MTALSTELIAPRSGMRVNGAAGGIVVLWGIREVASRDWSVIYQSLESN